MLLQLGVEARAMCLINGESAAAAAARFSRLLA